MLPADPSAPTGRVDDGPPARVDLFAPTTRALPAATTRRPHPVGPTAFAEPPRRTDPWAPSDPDRHVGADYQTGPLPQPAPLFAPAAAPQPASPSLPAPLFVPSPVPRPGPTAAVPRVDPAARPSPSPRGGSAAAPRPEPVTPASTPDPDAALPTVSLAAVRSGVPVPRPRPVPRSAPAAESLDAARAAAGPALPAAAPRDAPNPGRDADGGTTAAVPARPAEPAGDVPTPTDRSRLRTGRPSSGPAGRAALVAAVLVGPVVPLTLGVGDRPEVPPPAATVPAMPSGTVPIASNAEVVPPTPGPARPVAAPSGLSVPSIGLDVGAPERLGLDAGGRLGAPVDVTRIGWFAQGPKPGEAGPAVIVGHVDSDRGPAVLSRLADLTPGRQIVVPRTDGRRTTFTVDAVERYPKDAFPSHEVYGQTANAQLRLITCGGAFDRSEQSYEDNIVVFASVH